MARISGVIAQNFPIDDGWSWAVIPGEAQFVSARVDTTSPDLAATMYFEMAYDVEPYELTPTETTTIEMEASRVEVKITSEQPITLAEYLPQSGTVAVLEGPSGPLFVQLRIHHHSIVQQKYVVEDGQVVSMGQYDIPPNPFGGFVDPPTP